MSYIQTANTLNLLCFYVWYIDIPKYRDIKHTFIKYDIFVYYILSDAEIYQ